MRTKKPSLADDDNCSIDEQSNRSSECSSCVGHADRKENVAFWQKKRKKKKTRLKNLGEKLNYDVKKVARIQGWTKGTYYQAGFFFLIKTM